MDENVRAAMARWPNVPDVYGWLSLSERGQWRLHPLGDALSKRNMPPGETITNLQILLFINRNYACDEHGQWFFQNGPQRVFVRLDGAPYILRTVGSPFQLTTHNDLPVHNIQAWFLDDTGKLYAQTEYGPGLVDGRDLTAIAESLYTGNDESLTALLERDPTPTQTAVKLISSKEPEDQPNGKDKAALLSYCTAAQIPALMRFVRFPSSNFVTLGSSLK